MQNKTQIICTKHFKQMYKNIVIRGQREYGIAKTSIRQNEFCILIRLKTKKS